MNTKKWYIKAEREAIKAAKAPKGRSKRQLYQDKVILPYPDQDAPEGLLEHPQQGCKVPRQQMPTLTAPSWAGLRAVDE
jgi:hypothetical protein